MTDEELENLRSINDGITAIADRLQAVIANYDQRIITAEKRLVELEGNCRYRGMEKLRDRDDNTKKIEDIENKINNIENKTNCINMRVSLLVAGNAFVFILFIGTLFIIFNPEFHAALMHVLNTVTP